MKNFYSMQHMSDTFIKEPREIKAESKQYILVTKLVERKGTVIKYKGTVIKNTRTYGLICTKFQDYLRANGVDL